MILELSDAQKESQARFRSFVRAEIAPQADRWDSEGRLPAELISRLGQEGYLGAFVPVEYGGRGMDMLTYGILNEEIGRGCSSVRSLLTVHGMVEYAILRWGNATQKQRWLPRLATGEVIGAFGLTEPTAGSDAAGVQTSAIPAEGGYILTGTKVWTTFGQIADVVLVFAQQAGKLSAFLVETRSPGFSRIPTSGILGTRASMLASLRMESCLIPKENSIGHAGFGLSAVGSAALDLGRYTVACGCVGIAQACLDAAIEYATTRKQYGSLLKDHQLIRKMITEMAVNVSAARGLCYRAGYLKDTGDPRTLIETLIAKYFAAKAAAQCASDAVQIHGANGCGSDYPVQRYYRDSKIMEIIEGSNQILELTIAKHACDNQGGAA
jgi:alkylation response protein AidB-like acyl-CoA dehydrogenase